MSDLRYANSPNPPAGTDPRRDVSGVLGARLFAWVADVLVLAVLTLFIALLLLLLGLPTFGLTWLLIPSAAVLTALGYSALTIGGRHQASWGMRMAGLRVETIDRGAPDGVTAAVHALLFYVTAGTVALWVLDIACGLLREDRRLGRDLVTGLVVVRS